MPPEARPSKSAHTAACAEQFINEGSWPDIDDKACIEQFFVEKVSAGLIPSEVRPQDWSRFCDNVYRLLQAMLGERPTGRSERKLTNLSTALRKLKAHIESLGSDQFPRSISLYQYTLGVLVQSGEVQRLHPEYVAVVTPELTLLFPETASLEGRFAFTNTPVM